MRKLLEFFWFSLAISAVALVAMYFYGGVTAFVTAALLAVLEVTLSFDNAVVNARVLRKMSVVWQRRFLTWGILIAVVGTRLVLPILIVSAVVWASPWAIAEMAFLNPAEYGHLLEGARYAIHAFGAAFLIMVSLKYFLNDKKEVHWIRILERHLASWGRVESVEIALALIIIAGLSFLVPAAAAATVLVAGVIGVVLFILMEGITTTFSVESSAAASGLALFVYLNVLDSAFSLDSVVGAFALTSALPVIVVGLGIGAYFVRSLTLYMVREHTLDTLKYLEHGAHWAIFGLAVSMFVSLLLEVPEIVTGTIGIIFVVAAYWSSVRLRS
ncbi:MAG: DUF475 domain-containing protein [Patescibacteria group bacterium]